MLSQHCWTETRAVDLISEKVANEPRVTRTNAALRWLAEYSSRENGALVANQGRAQTGLTRVRSNALTVAELPGAIVEGVCSVKPRD